VRTAAVSGLGSIGDPASIAALIAILKRKPTEDDEMLRRSAARSIGQVFHLITFGNTGVVTPQNFLQDKYKSLGDVLALERTNPKTDFEAAKATLGNVLQNTKEADDVRREAAFALGESRDPAVSSLLRPFLRSADPYLAEICKEGLLKIEAPAGLTPPSGN
jgi:HEAT repeat protein